MYRVMTEKEIMLDDVYFSSSAQLFFLRSVSSGWENQWSAPEKHLNRNKKMQASS